MKNKNRFYWTLVPAVSLSLLAIAGCGPTTKSDKTDSAEASINSKQKEQSSSSSSLPHSDQSEHGHKPGAHGGIMVSLGRDSYHVEAVIDSSGSVRLYTLGQDESRVFEVENQTLKGFVKAFGDTDSKPIAFEPSPQEGDTLGKTSLFVAQLPSELIGKKLDVTIPNIRIEGERFRLGFVSGDDDHGPGTEMPEKLADSEEKELYLVPGGQYTAADIEANGGMTASQKFKGIKSAHDMNPKQGDRICPITETKANPKFSWIIGGKSYQFCCPPCVDEFLKSAKASQDPLPDPTTFVKQ
jgi:YHS domain-containing protein